MKGSMYKVGQRVRITSIASTPWWHFDIDDKERFNNKIFKLVDDLGTGGNSHGWQVETPFGKVIFTEDQFRALKKKNEVKVSAKIPVMSLKSEVIWLNKVKKNFENAGEVYSPEDEGSAYRIPIARTVLSTPPRQVREDEIARRTIFGTTTVQGNTAPARIDWNDEGIEDTLDETPDADEER